MTATVTGIFTRQPVEYPEPHMVDAGTWWHCPEFCDGDCLGGEGIDWGNGRYSVSRRTHMRTVYAVSSADECAATVEVSAVEDYEDGFTGPPSVSVEVSADLAPEQAEAFAAAVVYAATLARQSPPMITRPSFLPSLGGGRATIPSPEPEIA